MAYGSKTSKSSGAKSVVSRVSKTPTKPLSFKEDLESRTGFKPPVENFRGTQSDEKLILNRDVFDKLAFNNTVDTNFTELDQVAPDLSFFDPNLATVNDFFSIYQNLFYQIPKFGETNSHEFLVVESTAYSNVIENQDQIDALLEEIVDLREQNLQLQLDITALAGIQTTLEQAIEQTNNVDTETLEDILQQEADIGAEQGNSSSDLLGTTSDGSTLPSQGGSTGGGGGGGGGGGIPGVTEGLTDAFGQETGGDPFPPNQFGPGGPGSANPGMPKF